MGTCARRALTLKQGLLWQRHSTERRPERAMRDKPRSSGADTARRRRTSGRGMARQGAAACQCSALVSGAAARLVEVLELAA